jgi:hypothetical protein
VTLDLEGPDAHTVTMPPAPTLGSSELAHEMAEVYELALLRDQPLVDFTGGTTNPLVQGPYLSQFMLIGNIRFDVGSVSEGLLQYEALTIDQQVPIAAASNWMTTFPEWLAAQHGENLRNHSTLLAGRRRFITYPRDLATYVPDDARYEAYLNTCLILLSMGAGHL